MAQIPDDIRQAAADAAEGYLNAYLQKEAQVTDREQLYEDAIEQDDTNFDGENIPINALKVHSTNARNFYGEIASLETAYDVQLAEYGATVIAFLSEYSNGTTIDFINENKRLSLVSGNIVVTDIN